MRKRERAIWAAASVAVLGSVSVAMASTPLLTDNFDDSNPLTTTVNGVATPTYTVTSYEGTNDMHPVAGDPSTISNPITIKSGSVAHEGPGGLTLTVAQNGYDYLSDGGAQANIGPVVSTAVSSQYNFWQHPVQITINAPAGGNLMPQVVQPQPANNQNPLNGVNQSSLFMSLNAGAGRPDNSAAEITFQLTNPWYDSQYNTTRLTTQYVIRATPSSNIITNNANPTFSGTIPPDARITSMTMSVDGSKYNPSLGAGSLNTTPLMFNWGVNFVEAGVKHTFWYWNSAGTFGPSAVDATRADVNLGYGSFTTSGNVQFDLSALHDAWASVGNASLDSAVGYELLRSYIVGNQQPLFTTLGSVSVIDPRTPGDTNFDQVVNTADFVTLAANFNNGTGKIWYQGDFNGDGIVNALDFNALASNFGYNAQLAPALGGSLVPEPATMAGLAIAVLAIARRRRG